MRLAHSQTGSGADRVLGLRGGLSQEVCWTRPRGHIFNMSQLWMTYRHSEKGVCVCVCAHACMHVHTQDLYPYFSWFWKLKISCWLPLVLQAQVFAVAGRCLWQVWLHNNCVNKKKKIVGKSIVCSKWTFDGGALLVVYTWRMLSSLVIFFFLLQFFEEAGCWSRRGKSKLASFALKARVL